MSGTSQACENLESWGQPDKKRRISMNDENPG